MAVYLLALGAALLFGAGSVAQQQVAFDAPPGKSLRPSLLWWLARQPLWLVGVATALVGNLLSGAALGLGSVALVQPLLVSRLLFALPLAAALAHQRLGRRDWVGVVATAGGLAAFLAVGRPSPGTQTPTGGVPWLIAGAAVAGLALLLVRIARKRAPSLKAPMLGAGAGMLFGLQSGLTHVAVNAFFQRGIGALLMTWQTYAVAVSALCGTLLIQSAYEMAPLQSSYPAMSAVEPLSGIGLGVGVLGGTLTVGVVPVTTELVALVVMMGGTFLLASSSLVTARGDAMRQRQQEELAYSLEEDIARRLDSLQEHIVRAETTGDLSSTGEMEETMDHVRERLERLSIRNVEGRPPAAPQPDASRAGTGPHHQARAMVRWHRESVESERRLRSRADLTETALRRLGEAER